MKRILLTTLLALTIGQGMVARSLVITLSNGPRLAFGLDEQNVVMTEDGNQLYFNGYSLNHMKKRKIPEFRRTIGVVFQDYRLIDTLTVYENIAFVLRVIDAPRKLIRKRVPYVMSLVGLQDKADCYPSELSGGEQQRCALARALVNDPALLIADEPTGNVDPELAYELVELLKGINACGTTILMVTHAHEMVRHFGGRIINISEGEVVFDEVIGGAEIEAE